MLVGLLLPVSVLYLLCALDVPLGKPAEFAYLYSPIPAQRLSALPAAFAVGLLFAAAGWLAISARRSQRAGGAALYIIAVLAGGAWCFLSPPEFASQHYFNMASPSQDGAFLIESSKVSDLNAYLRHFPQRARTPEEEMRGTRVISNPPGATLVAWAVRAQLHRQPGLQTALEGAFVSADVDNPQHRRDIATGVAFALVLAALWLAAAPFLYLAARELLPHGPSLLITAACLFTPATLGLSPGKDPAQLLTVALPLWLWLRAARQGQSTLAALAGAVFPLTLLVSLVHVWIAAIAIVTTAIDAAARRGLIGFAMRVAAPAGVAAVLVLIVLYFATGAAVIDIARAVAAAQATVTRGPDAMPWYWQALGVPLFLLFAGPAFWIAALWLCAARERDDLSRFGLIVLTATGGVLLGTVVFTNIETPRLWIPFTPLLLIGLLAQVRWSRLTARAAAGTLALLLGAQFAASAISWAVMDMREAENRLVEDPRGEARMFH